MIRTPTKLRVRFIGLALLCLASIATAQFPASFQAPTLGFLFDAESRTIRPIAGIAGSSRIDAPLSLPLTVDTVGFFPDQRHAIVGSRDSSSALVADLKDTRFTPINDAPAAITSMEISPGGTAAAIYYADTRRILIVTGFFNAPAILSSIDLSFANGPLSEFAIADDGTVALLAFSSTPQDSLYSWTASSGPRYVLNASHISDIAFLGEEAVVLDSASDQALWIRNIRGTASSWLAANSGDGLSRPVAVAASRRNEIYIGDAEGGILILDTAGRILKKTRCNCAITSMAPLANTSFRLTDRIDRPMYVLDGNDAGRIFFIPALIPLYSPGSGR